MMRNRQRKRGSALVEMAFMMPWIAFLFVGILDFGFYSYGAIATQNAARAVALQSASGSAINICQSAKNEMGFLSNVPGTSCAATQAGVSNTTPIWVCTGTLTNTTAAVCGQPTAICADCALDNQATSIKAVVTYMSIPLVPIPGILTGKLTLTRIAEARIIQ
jgi:Flp pilus assembly protein TadG